MYFDTSPGTGRCQSHPTCGMADSYLASRRVYAPRGAYKVSVCTPARGKRNLPQRPRVPCGKANLRGNQVRLTDMDSPLPPTLVSRRLCSQKFVNYTYCISCRLGEGLNGLYLLRAMFSNVQGPHFLFFVTFLRLSRGSLFVPRSELRLSQIKHKFLLGANRKKKDRKCVCFFFIEL